MGVLARWGWNGPLRELAFPESCPAGVLLRSRVTGVLDKV